MLKSLRRRLWALHHPLGKIPSLPSTEGGSPEEEVVSSQGVADTHSSPVEGTWKVCPSHPLPSLPESLSHSLPCVGEILLYFYLIVSFWRRNSVQCLPCTSQDMQPRSLPVSHGTDFGIGCQDLISNGKETQSTGPAHSVSVQSRPGGRSYSWGAS